MKTKIFLFVVAVIFATVSFSQDCDYSQPCLPVPAGLMNWWPGDNSTDDLIGSHNGTLMNGAAYAPGKVCYGFLLDGVDDYVAIADDPAWTLGTNNFTIDLWANLNVVKFGEYWEPYNTLIAHDEASFDYKKWIFYLTGTTIAFIIDDPANGPTFMNIDFTPEPNVWYHFAVTRSGITFSFYADGILLGTAESDQPILDADIPLTIGWCEAPQNYFDGIIDEVDIFNRALSADEILAIYSAGCVGKCKSSCQAGITPAGPISIPVGGSVILTASEGISYEWSTGETTQSIEVTTSGEYSVLLGCENSCFSMSPPVTVTANAPVNTPLSDWAIALGIALMAGVVVWYWRRS